MTQDQDQSKPGGVASELSTRNEGEGGEHLAAGELQGMNPKTKHGSKMVMLAAGRGDRIEITNIVERFETDQDVPNTVTVIERNSTYYGPKLLVHSDINGKDYNYLLNAPGPANELVLWGARTDDENYRKGWYSLAEVEAELAEDRPSYEICSQCGNPLRSVEHERRAALGMCDQ